VSEDTVIAADWPERADAHERRVRNFLDGHRGPDGRPHPVWDFLFTYYSLRPGHLICWHPGYGVQLRGATAVARYAGRTGYVVRDQGVTVGAQYLAKRRDTVVFIAELLTATATRPAQFNCFGLHEWAMVYRSDEVRHRSVPLRLGSAGTDAVVESMPLRCSHFDAFRFFTAAAAPRNTEQLTRKSQLRTEQPGCLHANMDLTKWALKLGPLVASELLIDCLELAAEARTLDMAASPYDLRDYGLAPVAVENPADRNEYVRRQRDIAARATPLRARLIEACQQLARRAESDTLDPSRLAASSPDWLVGRHF
jgi:hypothetical protein